MNKAELIATVAEVAGLSKKDSEKAVNATFDAITAALEAGEKVSLVGFGAFDVKERAARMGRNPRTKEDRCCLWQSWMGGTWQRCSLGKREGTRRQG